MFGLFGLFGRSSALKALDQALRAAGLHPAVVPEAVKLTIVRLNRHATAPQQRDAAFGEAACLLAYCMLGRAQFETSNGTEAAERAEERLEAAMAAGDSLDARLVLLAMHAGVIAPEFTARLDVESS